MCKNGKAEKQKASAKAEKDASGGAEKRARAASRMQFLHKAYQTDRDEKVAQKELAKAEAEAAKGDGNTTILRCAGNYLHDAGIIFDEFEGIMP